MRPPATPDGPPPDDWSPRAARSSAANRPAPAGRSSPADRPTPPRPPASCRRSASKDASAPPSFAELALTAGERAQIEEQLSDCFGLTPAAARTWLETTARHGVCFGRVLAGRVAASFAAETLTLVRGGERLTAVMLQSYYVHPSFRGRGFGLERADVERLRRRFAAGVVVLTLFDDGLVPYWRRRGFEVVQRAEVVTVDECLARVARAFSPALDERALEAKLAEVAADGATVTEQDGLVLVRHPGDDVVDELVVRPTRQRVPGVDASGARPPGDSTGAWGSVVPVRLKTVMASPGGLDLVCPIDL